LIGFGTVMSMAASPAVAERLGYAHLHFAERHLVMVPLALAIMLGVSLMPPRIVRRVAFVGFAVAIVGAAMTSVSGAEIAASGRWWGSAGASARICGCRM